MILHANSLVFENLIAPIDTTRFYSEYWETKPLLIKRNDYLYYKDILALEDINLFLSRTDIRYPTIRLVKDGMELSLYEYSKTLSYGDYSGEGLIDNDKLFSHFNNGATIVLQLIHKSITKLTLFTNAIEKYFNFRVQTNVYVTPKNSQGFSPHYDDHCVFIMQITGKKMWRLYDSLYKLPLKGQKFNKKEWQRTEPVQEILLEPGDLLYIPRGFIHDALTNEDISMHITFGIFPHTWFDIFDKLLNEFKEDVELRRSPMNEVLSNSDSLSILDKQFNGILNTLKSWCTIPDILNQLFTESNSRQIPNNKDRFKDFYLLETLSIVSKLKIRDGLSYKVKVNKDSVIISFFDKAISLPLNILPALEYITTNERFDISNIQTNLDAIGKMTLCKKLIVEGFLIIEEV